MHPDDDMLADLALGEKVPSEVASHVAACPTCTAQVDSLRTVARRIGQSREVVLVPPPDRVWSAILADLEADVLTEAPEAPPVAVDEPAGSGAFVDLSARRSRRQEGERTGPARVPWPWMAAAAVAGVVLGALGVATAGVLGESSEQVVAQSQLTTVDTDQTFGAADLVDDDGQVSLQVDVPSVDPGDGYVEVWLINTDLTRMVSVGVLSDRAGPQRFPVTRDLIDQGYLVVDLSHEAFDDQPAHSGDSIARGTLAT